jgi:hypothetical protein
LKKTFLLIILTGITFLGCSDNFDNNLVSTPTQTKNATNSVISRQFIKSVSKDTDQAFSPLLFASKTINGEIGGEIIIDTSYVNYQGRLLYVYAKLKVKEFTFQGTTEFTMKFHPEIGSIELYPHMVFDNEVQLWVTYEGINLKELGFNCNDPVDFVFFNDNGEIEVIRNDLARINLAEQRIKVAAALIPHFSRYGWIRKNL